MEQIKDSRGESVEQFELAPAGDDLELLPGLLARLSALYAGLHDLMVLKREAMVRMDVKELERTIGQEGDLLVQLEKAEHERSQLHTRICRARGLEPAHTALLDLALSLPEPWRGRLTRARHQLFRQARKLGRLNELNRDLTVQGLCHVRDMLQVLVCGGGSEVTYSKPGSSPTAPGAVRKFVDEVI